MDTIFTDGQLTKAIETMRQKGMTPERFNRLLSSGIFADICDTRASFDNRQAVRRALNLDMLLPEQLALSVDYTRSFARMIAVGHYNWINRDITAERFSVEGSGLIHYETLLLHWDRGITPEKAIEAIVGLDITNEKEWEPAKIEHLLAFGEKYPEEQRKYPIVALGSIARINHRSALPYLYVDDRERGLDLLWWQGSWRIGIYRFLAVRRLPLATQA